MAVFKITFSTSSSVTVSIKASDLAAAWAYAEDAVSTEGLGEEAIHDSNGWLMLNGITSVWEVGNARTLRSEPIPASYHGQSLLEDDHPEYSEERADGRQNP